MCHLDCDKENWNGKTSWKCFWWWVSINSKWFCRKEDEITRATQRADWDCWTTSMFQILSCLSWSFGCIWQNLLIRTLFDISSFQLVLSFAFLAFQWARVAHNEKLFQNKIVQCLWRLLRFLAIIYLMYTVINFKSAKRSISLILFVASDARSLERSKAKNVLSYNDNIPKWSVFINHSLSGFWLELQLFKLSVFELSFFFC